jgi:hypothetical protein
MKSTKKLTKKNIIKVNALISDFIDGKEPNYLIRNYGNEYRRHNVPSALIRNPETNGCGGIHALRGMS